MKQTKYPKKKDEELLSGILQELKKIREAIELIAMLFKSGPHYFTKKDDQKEKFESFRTEKLIDYEKIKDKADIPFIDKPFDKKK